MILKKWTRQICWLHHQIQNWGKSTPQSPISTSKRKMKSFHLWNCKKESPLWFLLHCRGKCNKVKIVRHIGALCNSIPVSSLVTSNLSSSNKVTKKAGGTGFTNITSRRRNSRPKMEIGKSLYMTMKTRHLQIQIMFSQMRQRIRILQ